MKLRQFLQKSLFKKCLIITGLFLLIVCLYILSFIYGKPTIETDYLAQLNQINKPENYNPQNNAWSYYQKAFELYTEPNSIEASQIIFNDFPKDFSDYNDIEQKLISEWIEQNQPAWQEFVIASNKPYCYIEYEVHNSKDDSPVSDSMKKLDIPTMKLASSISSLRSITYSLGRSRVKMNLEKGNIEQAIEDCFAFFKTASLWQKDKKPVDQIVGLHLNSIGNECLLKILNNNKLSLNQLEDIQKRLTYIYESHPIELDFTCEKFEFMDIVQHIFTKGGIGGGHIIPKYLPPFTQISSIIISMGKLKTDPTIKERFMFFAMSMLHARRNKTIAKYNELIEQINEIQSKTLYERKQSNFHININRPDILNFQINFNSFTQQSRYYLVSLSIPGIERITKFVPQKKAEYEATITVLALKRYAIEKGNYPESLQELINAGYITKLPMDPYSDKPLIYKKAGDDFTLYSVGEDFKDDKGKLLFSGKHLLKWGDSNSKTGGDAVFWPVQ